jgi:DNA-binding transcriptional MerR regulator/methanogenic corrinoid protein MtbC1
MDQPCHTIKMAAKLTGLSPHVIRVWEKRYSAVVPNRSESRRRLFTGHDLERLNCLRQATEAGHNIGAIAKLTNASLIQLVLRTAPAGPLPLETAQEKVNGREGMTETGGGYGVETLIRLVRAYDQEGLLAQLRAAHTELGSQGLLVKVIAPLARALGDLWAAGDLTAADEHFASATLREYLLTNTRQYAGGGHPTVLVVTPAGQLHELGAVMVAFAARNQGWNTVYLGASLPAAEIAGAAARHQARAVALSIVFPADDIALSAELLELWKHLPANTKILAGGRAAPSYQPALRRIGAVIIDDLPELFQTLGNLRTRPE